MIEENRVRRAGNSRLQIGIGKYDVGRLSASSSETFLRFPAAACRISLPTSVEPVKATLSTSLMSRERGAGGLAVAGNDVDHAVGESGFLNQLRQPQRRERRLLGGLEHDAVSPWPAPDPVSRRPSAAGNSTE